VIERGAQQYQPQIQSWMRRHELPYHRQSQIALAAALVTLVDHHHLIPRQGVEAARFELLQ
jgi:hypothetical protein